MSPRFKLGRIALGICISGAVGAVSASGEPVADIARITGGALVDQGSDYVSAAEGMRLRDGDRVLALEGGTALIHYREGCQSTIGDKEVHVVNGSACVDGVLVQSAGATGGAASADTDDDDDELAWVPPAAAAAVTVFAFANTGGSDGNKRSMSPE